MKTMMLGLSLLTCVSLYAEDINSNMKSMRDGLIKIQDGFLYNNQSGISDGIKMIKKANKSFHTPQKVEKILPKQKKNFYNVTVLSSQRLDADLEQMNGFIQHGDMLRAAEIHSDIVSDCTRCHAIVRRW